MYLIVFQRGIAVDWPALQAGWAPGSGLFFYPQPFFNPPFSKILHRTQCLDLLGGLYGCIGHNDIAITAIIMPS